MPEVLEAHRAYKKTDADALLMRFRGRAQLGLAVVRQLEKPGATIVQIAGELGVTDEQVRRYRQAYRDWLRDHPDEPLD
jgi:predicted transcriptional regulator